MSIGKRSRSQVARSRPVVFARDGHECVVAGLFEAVRWPCMGSLTVQHRRGKGMGGSALADTPESLLCFCAFHNVLQTADAEFDARCREYGWSVPRWVADQYAMNRIPVKYADGWFFLDGDVRVSVPHRVAVEIVVEIYGTLDT